MDLAIIYSRATTGVTAPLVTVEVHLSRGIPRLNIVGLPQAAVQESKDRVRSALLNTLFQFPRNRITVNLAPADLPKEGGKFDLPIALGILAASQQIPKEHILEYEFTGELALSGELRPVRGVLPMVLSARQMGRQIIVPEANAHEAALAQYSKVFSANHLLEVCAYLKGDTKLPMCAMNQLDVCVTSGELAEVCGQLHGKRALEIAAAGKHSLLLVGPPGTGKTMLANCLPSILPPLNDAEALEIAAVSSISLAGFDARSWKKMPIRSPHHSSSMVALVGGGRPPRPGEISLAHQGVLFLDELPEFNRTVLESLREPLESGSITISRAAYQTIFPAKFQLIAAMNPCPCGMNGHAQSLCRCTQEQIQRYVGKLSDPFLDRIDMQVEMPSLTPEFLALPAKERESSAVVKNRVLASRQIQLNRQRKCNAELKGAEILVFCQLHHDSQNLLNQVMNKFNLSARVYHRILKLARTIADLEQCESIEMNHLSEALLYRFLDKTKLTN